jgi:hypothetical protein
MLRCALSILKYGSYFEACLANQERIVMCGGHLTDILHIGHERLLLKVVDNSSVRHINPKLN